MEPLIPNTAELLAILPEIILVVAMCVALIVPVLPPFRATCRSSHGAMLTIAVAGLLGALVAALAMLGGRFGLSVPDAHVMANMLAVDRFALTFKVILYLFTLLVIGLWVSVTRNEVRPPDGPDYVTLILGGVLGMSLMASATNFLMIFLAIESASFPSYALAGFRKSTRRASEASMKYVLFGSASSAFMLYGLSMAYGAYGTLDLSTLALSVADSGMSVGLMLGLFGFLIGVGFKLSAVPVHFWCPDVFEGASFEITTFLSVASKGAAIALLLRVMTTFGFFAPPSSEGMLIGIGSFVGLIGAVTATWGNLAAYFQTNVKRLLAYSSIAHAGYMIMAAGLLTASLNHRAPQELAYAILFYLIVYAFMNLGAFTIAAVVAADRDGDESLDAFNGLAMRSPMLAIAFGVLLMSLFGMPLTGGFWGKVRLGFEMWNEQMWWLVLILVINTVFSLYFYLKPIIVMVWKPAPTTSAARVPGIAAAIVAIAVLGVAATGLFPDPTTRWAESNAVLGYFPDREPPITAPVDEAVDETAFITAPEQ
ncbi:MAG: NADH-quinone oxidoreductase subunit N [Phycisphaerales bacterium]